MADRIVVLHRGRTLGELDPAGQDVERAFFARVLDADRRQVGGAVSAALEFELLKARRAAVFHWGAVAVVVGVPGLATVFFVLARSGGRSAAVAKATARVTDDSLAGLLGLTGQVLTVAMLLTAGIAASWSFGREFVDDADPALFALATPRRPLAAAKFWVLTGWAACTVVVAVVLTLLAGLGLGLPLQADGLTVVLRATIAGLLSAVLAWPLALVASWRRGYWPALSPCSWS